MQGAATQGWIPIEDGACLAMARVTFLLGPAGGVDDIHCMDFGPLVKAKLKRKRKRLRKFKA